MPFRGYWDDEEEQALRDAVQKHGIGSWEKMRHDPDFKVLKGRTGVQLKDKWRNLIKFQHLRRGEAESAPHRTGGRGPGPGAKRKKADDGDGKAGKKAKPGAKGTAGKKDDKPGKPGAKGKVKGKVEDYDDEDAFDTDDKPGKASGGKTGYGKKQKLGVSADAVSTKSTEPANPKKRLKAVAALAAVEEHRPPPDLDALERAMQADAMKIDELRRGREAAVGEVKDAEKELLAVKTSVEDAEAVYNNVRSQPPGGYHHEGIHHDHDHDHHDDAHHDDWDKFLDFGDEGAEGAEGAGAKSPHRQPRHSQGAPPRVSENDPVARAAAAAKMSDPVQSPAAAAAMRDAANAAVRVASEPVHNPNHRSHLPSLHEAEQFLLQELKKLEAANARLMSARAHLEVIDRQLAAAIASAAERSEQRVAMMRRNPALGGPVKKTWGGPPGARKIKEEIKEEEDDEDEEDDEEDDDDDAEERKKTTHRRNTAASAGGAPGGKVIEDRRFGIYDSRRYRMEGEPAPPDPSSDEDDEPKVGRGRGRAASAGAGKSVTGTKTQAGRKPPRVTPVSADAVSVGVAGRGRGRGAGAGGGRGRGRGRPPKNQTIPNVDSGSEIVSTKAGTNLKRHQGFQFRGQNNSGAFVAPSAADAATYIAPSYIRGHHLRWLMKRGRTRHAVARPASGPTSWAAMCSFALWKPAELKAAIAREKEKEKEREMEATDEEESDEDEDGGYDSEESGPIGSGHAHIDFDAFGYEMGDDGDMGMIMDMDFGEDFHPGMSP